MNKSERRKSQLLRHYATLEKLAIKCGVKQPDGKKLSVKLLKLEREASRITTAYCNGDMDQDQADNALDPIREAVNDIFHGELQGFFINRDPRGYAIKIDDADVRETYADINLHRDMGGYGILAPEIDGN